MHIHRGFLQKRDLKISSGRLSLTPVLIYIKELKTPTPSSISIFRVIINAKEKQQHNFVIYARQGRNLKLCVLQEELKINFPKLLMFFFKKKFS